MAELTITAENGVFQCRRRAQARSQAKAKISNIPTTSAPAGHAREETEASQEKGISAGLGNRTHARRLYVDVVEADVFTACRGEASNAELRQRRSRREIKSFKVPHCRVRCARPRCENAGGVSGGGAYADGAAVKRARLRFMCTIESPRSCAISLSDKGTARRLERSSIRLPITSAKSQNSRSNRSCGCSVFVSTKATAAL